MKVARLKNLEKVVKEILENDEYSRKDDCYLILEVIRKMFPYEVGKTFATVMFNAKNKGISFESITRARRKIQRKHPELKDNEISEIREAEQEEYKQYAKEEQEK